MQLLARLPLLASEYEEDAIEDDFRRSWSFTQLSVREEKQYLATYDPRREANDGWELVSVDEWKPRRRETYWFIKDRSAVSGNESEYDSDTPRFIEPGTLILLEETGEYWLFSFVPVGDEDDEKFMQQMKGTLKVVKKRSNP